MKDIPKIKITMLGTTSAGKTCYMLGMYARMQMGIEGFTLRATDLDQEIELTDRWSKLIRETGETRWPPPNQGVTENYIFEFSYGFKPMIQFDWLDYRGGALMAKSNDKDRQELHNHLISSQGVLLTVSGDLLANPVDDHALQLIRRDANVNSMNWFLTELAKARNISSEQPFPVVILITKFDKCHHRPREELIDDLKKMFNVLLTKGSGDGWLVLICPVTLGKDLAHDLANGSIDPRNVELPMIFAVYAHYSAPYLEIRANEIALENKRSQMVQKSGLKRWWDGDDLEQTIADLSLTQEQRKEFEKKVRLAADKLRAVDLFFDGDRWEVDV